MDERRFLDSTSYNVPPKTVAWNPAIIATHEFFGTINRLFEGDSNDAELSGDIFFKRTSLDDRTAEYHLEISLGHDQQQTLRIPLATVFSRDRA